MSDSFSTRSQQWLGRLLLQASDNGNKEMALKNPNDASHRQHTLEEYFALESEADARYEYWDGTILCMSGGTPQHACLS